MVVVLKKLSEVIVLPMAELTVLAKLTVAFVVVMVALVRLRVAAVPVATVVVLSLPALFLAGLLRLRLGPARPLVDAEADLELDF